MQKSNISNSVIRRLPRYYRFLGELLNQDIQKISSRELSEKMRLTASQIRQDLNCFGGFGQQGYGYNVAELRRQIGHILGLDQHDKIIIIGAGNLGRAITVHIGFQKYGYELAGIFDSNISLENIEISGIKIMHTNRLAEFCKDGKLNFEDLGASLDDNLGSVENTFNATLDPADQFKVTLNQLKDAGFDVGNALGPVLAECLQVVTPILKDLIESWNSLSPETQEMIIKCALLAAALGPVFSIVSKVSGGISSVISVGAKVAPVMSKAKTAFGAFNAVLMANPVLLVVIAVTTLIAILVTLYNKCEWFRNGVNAAFGGIKSFIAGVVDSIKGFLSFDWKLPKIKLPHFKIKGGFSLTPPKTPKFSVDWYAKGGILNSPTIFGTNGNSLMGGGEAGKEAVLPIDLLRSYIREENQGNNEVLAQMIAEAMSRIPLTVENNIQLGDKKLADVLVDAIIKKMSQSVKWKKGAVGA